MLDGHECSVEGRFFTPAELAERWRLTAGTLANLRWRGEGVPYIKLNDGEVLYREVDVLTAERDGQRGFSWNLIETALADCPGVDSEQLANLMKRLRKALNVDKNSDVG